MIGETIGHYTIVGELGAGGMGAVYRARDSKLDRDVALKVLPPSMAADSERRARFLREAKAVATLQHPNIVTVHSVDEDDGRLFLTMELVEGTTLDALIPTQGLRLGPLLELAIPLADAVSYAHSKGVTHRDLKPTNIMVDDRKRPRVLDFGLVKLLEAPAGEDAATMTVDQDITTEGKILGTPAYMSPEQAQGLPVDERTDIFSLGVILYEMATGRRPFQGDTHISTISAVLKDEPASISDINATLPRHLSRIVLKCLAKDAGKRYQTAADLRIDLEGLKQETESGLEQEAFRPAPPPAPAPARRSPLGWVLPLAGALLLAGAFFVWQSLRPGDETTSSATSGDRPTVTATAAATQAHRTKIAVLPFENLGPAEDAYFANGVTDEITSRLASVTELGVISRQSASRYAQSDEDLRTIGRELGVDYVIDGSVRWQKEESGRGRVRVTPQLVRVSDDTQLWTGRYDEPVEEIFAVQDRIAQAVVEEMSSALGIQFAQRNDGPTTDSFEAYQAYLQGRTIMDYAGSTGSIEEARALFNKAISLDPDYADAWAALSMTHSVQAHIRNDKSEANLSQSREAASRALSLPGGNAFGHLAMGYYYYWGRNQYDRAYAEFEKTGQLHSDPEVMEAAAFTLRRSGKIQEALALQERALELNPKSVPAWREIAFTYCQLGRAEEARSAWRQAISESPMTGFLYGLMGISLAQATGDPEELGKALREAPQQEVLQGFWTYYNVLTRRYEDALESMDRYPNPVIESDDRYMPISLLRALVKKRMEAPDADTATQLALEELNEAVAQAPKDWRRRIARAQALALAGYAEEASQEASLATDLITVKDDALNGRVALEERAVIEVLAGNLDTGVALMRDLLTDPDLPSPRGHFLTNSYLLDHLDHPEIRGLLNPTP